MTTPALNIPIRADLGKFQQDMERAGTVATKALGQIAKNSATVAQNLLAMRQAAVAFEALRFVGVGRSLMPLSLAITAVTGTFKLMSYATELATQRIAEFDKIAKSAASSGVTTDFFQRITKASEATRLSIDDATKALKRFGEASTDKLNGSEIASRLAELTKAGNFQGNKGRAAFEGAATTEEKYRAIVKLIDEAMQKGERLAALDLAEKAFGKDVTDRLRANSSYLTEMLASADKMAATKLISDIDVGNALDLKRRMEEAQRILEERWKPVQDDLATLGMNYKESMIAITETMAEAVGFANQLYGWVKEIPGVFERAGNASFWDKLREWSESKGLNSRPEGLVLRGEPGFEQNTTADSPAMRQLRAGLQNQAAVAKAMREASDHVSKVYGDLSKRTDDVAKKTRDVNDEFDRATNTVNRHIARMEADVRAVGLGAGAMEAFRTKALLMAAAQQAGIPITAKLTSQIESQAAAAGRAALELAKARAASEIEFDQKTMFLSPDDLRIAQELRAIYGNDIPAALGSSEAKAIRFNDSLRQSKMIVADFGNALVSGLLRGEDAMRSLTNAAASLVQTLASKTLKDFLEGGNFFGDKKLGSSAGLVGMASAGLSGYQSANPFTGAMGGALAGAQFGPWGAALGGLLGAAGGFLGKTDQLNKARAEWEKSAPEFERFLTVLSGGVAGAISQQFTQLRSQAEQFIEKASKAQDFGAINRVLNAYSDAVIRETKAFKESFEGMLRGLEDGLGPQSPFASAAQRIKSVTDELQGFIDDARISFANDPIALAAGNNPLIAGGGETQVQSATEAAQQYLLSLLGAQPELSATSVAIQEMSGTAVALRAALVELGMTSEQAATAINNGVTLAMADLADKFSNDLQQEINSALGKDYLNDFSDLLKRRQQALDDAARLGTGTALVDRWFQVSAQKIIDDAGLAGAAIADLVRQFPELAGAVHDAQQERLRQAQEQLQNARSELASAQSALNSAYEAAKQPLDDVISRMTQFRDTFKRLKDSLLLNPSYSPLSAQDQYLEAQRQYRATRALAATGDATALDRLQTDLQAYLDQSRSYNASTEAYYNDFQETQADLASMDDALSRIQSDAQQQLAVLNQQVAGLITINSSVLSVEAAINNLTLAQQNVAAAMANLNNARNWGSRPEINRMLVAGLESRGVSYTGNFGDGEFGAWRATQSQSVNDIIAEIERSIPQSLIDFYARQNKVAPFQPAYAGGTNYAVGGLSLVGEQGPELMHVPRGARITPASQTRALFASASNDNSAAVVAVLNGLRRDVDELRKDTRAGASHVRAGVDGLAQKQSQDSAAARQQSRRPGSYGTQRVA